MTDRSAPRVRLASAAVALVAAVSVPLVAPATSAQAASGPVAARQGRADPPHLQQGWYDAMGLAKAHRVTRGKGAVVAVLDQYVDTTVPDLRGANVQRRTNCRGDKTPDVQDRRASHGTAMTTAIAGQGTGTGKGGLGVLGVAPDAEVRFYSFQYGPNEPDDHVCDGVESQRTVMRAARDGADIISISADGLFGLEDAIRKVVKMGVVVVAASGEAEKSYSPMGYPAAFPGVVSVLACDVKGHPWKKNPYVHEKGLYLQNDGKQWPTITAPGIDSELGSFYEDEKTWSSGITRTGTSGATAIVAGSLALLKSKYPKATGNQLIQTLIHTGSSFSDNKIRYKPAFGYGLIAVNTMLSMDPTKYPDVNPLFEGPTQVAKDFGPSVYGAQPSASPSPGPSAEAGGSGKASDSTSSPTTKADDAPASGQGVPVWVWPVGVLVLAGAAGATYAARRGRSSTRTTSTSSAPDLVPSSHDRNQGE